MFTLHFLDSFYRVELFINQHHWRHTFYYAQQALYVASCPCLVTRRLHCSNDSLTMFGNIYLITVFKKANILARVIAKLLECNDCVHVYYCKGTSLKSQLIV